MLPEANANKQPLLSSSHSPKEGGSEPPKQPKLKRKSTRSFYSLPAEALIKKGIPENLAHRMQDFLLVLLGASVFLLIGWAMLGKHAAEKQEALEKAHEPPEEAEEAETPLFLDIQSIFVSCLVLVLLTVCFERAKHTLEHHVPLLMQHVLQAMFGELTVLGFIALIAFCSVQAGLLERLSMLVYGEKERLVELFEGVHFLLFFVMVIFLVEACRLIVATLRAEEEWRQQEEQVIKAVGSAVPMLQRFVETYNVCKGYPWPTFSYYRLVQEKERLRLVLLRERFIQQGKNALVAEQLPHNFDFANYLRRRCCDEVAHLLHVDEYTWLAVICFLGLVLELPLLFEIDAHFSTWWLLGLSVLFYIASYQLQAKLDGIMWSLTATHPLLTVDGIRRASEEERYAISDAGPPPYERLKVSSTASKHEQLFWGGKHGPEWLLFTVRVQMLTGAVILAIGWTVLLMRPKDMYEIALSMIPVLDVVIAGPSALLPLLTIVISVEQMKDNSCIEAVLHEMKTENLLRFLKTLHLMATQARVLTKKQSGKRTAEEMALKAEQAIDPVKEAELRQAFDCFDKDGSGSIDRAELSSLMSSLGISLLDDELERLYAEMDIDGDGSISFEEFRTGMLEPADEQTPDEIATAIFSMIDKEGTGQVTSKALKDALRALSMELSEEDIDNAVTLFDTSRDGIITRKEFKEQLEVMKTFDKD
ncbi:hypothetical protein AB1Y20_008507 [Prymnesium parvum]|uniref:EF-hand domain-containing protein n=1 Tax=Prymnesium parvum TaxID=97485 RepID=A0AB34ITA6_PRYPA